MILEHFNELLEQIAHKPLTSVSIVVNLILIESLLSVDNAAVLATMVLDLPKDQRRKALSYGILGAYVFRGICLLFAAILIQIWWFKPLGGVYLLFLSLKHFFGKKNNEESPEEEVIEKKQSWLFRKAQDILGGFWATVVLVELMDLAFSIDNVIAANAYTKNIILVWIGVFIGILAMRFVAQGFVKLMEKYPFLDTSAYLVIGLLGMKLTLSLFAHFYPSSSFAVFLEGEKNINTHTIVWGDLLTSVFSIGVFFIPILTSVLFNFPRKK